MTPKDDPKAAPSTYTPEDLQRLLDYLAGQGKSFYECHDAFLRPGDHHDLIMRLRDQAA